LAYYSGISSQTKEKQMNMRDYTISGTDADGVKHTVSVRAESGADAVNEAIQRGWNGVVAKLCKADAGFMANCDRALSLQISMEHVRAVQGALS
jgi:hypothetical protein